MGSTKMMCVSQGNALEKTNVRMSIKHQYSLERMRYTVQGMSFPHTTSNRVHKLTISIREPMLVTTRGEDRG